MVRKSKEKINLKKVVRRHTSVLSSSPFRAIGIGAMLALLLFVVAFSVTPTNRVSSALPRAFVEESSVEKTIEVTGESFYQVHFNLDGYATPNSSYGILELDFTGSRNIQYLNLNVNGTWVIQNVPLLSVQSEQTAQTQRFWFPLGVSDGTQVSAVDYGYSVSEQILEAAPTRDSDAQVNAIDYVIYNGGQDIELDPSWPAATPVIGGIVTDTLLHVKANVPNQEAGINECAPTAVSNSLQYLNAHHSLGIAASELTIEKMKNATNWHTYGCWIWPDDNRPEGERNAWYEDKAAYIQEMGWAISTKLILPADISQVIAEIDACEDIEMEIGGHTVCVVGMADLGGGKYSVTIQHDSQQNAAGGTVTETGVWDSNTNTWSGALAGWGLNYFVVESPISVEIPGNPWPALIIGLVIALTLVISIRRHKRPRTAL